jgi:hypothetical protein
MVERVALFRAGQLDLRTLVQNLQGLLGAADLHDDRLVDEFWMHEAPIDGELELLTESWAPPGAASEEALEDHLTLFVRWVESVLADTDDART